MLSFRFLFATCWLLAAGLGCHAAPLAVSPDLDVPEVTWGTPVSLPALEHISAEVTVLGVRSAVFELEVTPTCASAPAGGKAELRSRLSTVGVARFFKATDGSSRTTVDLSSARPIESDVLILDGDVTRRYRARHKPGSAETSYLRSGKAPKQKTQRIRSGEHPLDMQSAFLLLRHWKAIPGEHGYFYVLLGNKMWKVSVEFQGVQVLEHRGKERPAIRLEGAAHRIRGTTGERSEPRRFSIWLSNDSARTPLRVEGDASFGRVNMELLSRRVEPGSAGRCRTVARAF